MKVLKSFFIIMFLMVMSSNNVWAQILPPDTAFNKKRLRVVVISESALWLSSVAGLNYAWYNDYKKEPWHAFNDNKEWLQMDKVGHVTTSYFLGKVGYDMLRWSGVSHKKSIWYGGSLGFIYLTSIEMLDAYSSNWGFSWGDMFANAVGSGIYMTQAAIWKEQRIALKYSYSKTQYADYRPNVLGKEKYSRPLKDYNGQTYWASANISSFMKKENHFPKWLNIAVGYGAEGMLGGFENPSMINGQQLPYFERYRQYYLALDIDLTRIPTKSKFLKFFFNIFSFIKIPAPTIEFSSKGTKFYPVYF